MLDLKYVAQNFDDVRNRLKTRGGGLDLGHFQKLVSERSELYSSMEALSHKRSQANGEIKENAQEDSTAIDGLRGEMRLVSDQSKEKEARLKALEEEVSKILYLIPNLPDPSVPVGASEQDNQVVKTWGEKTAFLFPPRQ